MKSIFKKSKKSPIKFSGYDYIGQHPDYKDVHYFIRSIGNDNYDFPMIGEIQVKLPGTPASQPEPKEQPAFYDENEQGVKVIVR